jgi:hypothetical protein
MLRVPKLPFAGPGTGRTNASLHKRSGADCSHTRTNSAASLMMRCTVGSGGFTNASSTRTVRVAKSPSPNGQADG